MILKAENIWVISQDSSSSIYNNELYTSKEEAERVFKTILNNTVMWEVFSFNDYIISCYYANY